MQISLSQRGAPRARRPSLNPLLLTQFIGLLVGQAYLILVSAVVSPLTGVAGFGALYVCDLVVRLFFTLFAGAYIDRFSPRLLYTVADGLRCLGLFGVFVFTLTPTAVIIFAAVALFAAGSSLGPALTPATLAQATVPAPVRERKMALWRILISVAGSVSPALAALVIPLAGPAAAVLTGCVLLLTVALADLIVVPRVPDRRREAREPLWGRLIGGYRVCLRHRVISLLLILDVIHVVFPVSLWMLVIQSPQLFGLPPGSQGWVLSAYAVGGILGAFTAARMTVGSYVVAAVTSQILFAAPLIGFAVVSGQSWWLLAGLAFVGGAGNEASSHWSSVYFSRAVEPTFLGRVFSVTLIAALAAMPVGIGILTVIIEGLGVALLAAAAAAVLVGSSLAALVILFLRRDTMLRD